MTSTEKVRLIEPVGGALVNLLVEEDQREALLVRARRLPSVRISQRSVCDLELLACGAFSPLNRFMGAEDYRHVLDDMHLANGSLFPIPISLPLPRESGIGLDQEVAIRNARDEILGTILTDEIYEWDLNDTCRKVFGTVDSRHPLIAEMHGWPKYNLSGRLSLLELPRYFDFTEYRLTPEVVRKRLQAHGNPNVVAFQTRNPLHRIHEELTKRAASQVAATLLLHPVVGVTKPGDVDYFARVRTYKVLLERYFKGTEVVLSLLPLAMRFAGPREAVWHALIRRNYGANYFIVGRDHASPGTDSNNNPFYGPYDAQELLEQLSEEIGVGVIPFNELVYDPQSQTYRTTSDAEQGESVLRISGSAVRGQYLDKGSELPEWFSRPEVAEILSQAYPPRHRQGFCVWFTGLSAAGKSTTAEILAVLLSEVGRRVTLLDGDVVRKNLSKGLGFSKEDRDMNVRRIGFVASEIVRHGGAAICAAISPYRATRNDVRAMVGNERFFEVYVDTPVAVCIQRDPKGVYAKITANELHGLSGIDDPYEPPDKPEFILDTTHTSAEHNARLILNGLTQAGFIKDCDKSQVNPQQTLRRKRNLS